jgi:hypothetical protein
LQKLGVKQGDSVCHADAQRHRLHRGGLCRDAARRLWRAVNWHFKPEEINYVLKDSGTSVLIAHADMLHQLREAIRPASPRSACRRRRKFSPTTRSIRSSRDAGFRDRFRIWLDAAPAL